jgi:hypothetical protein
VEDLVAGVVGAAAEGWAALAEVPAVPAAAGVHLAVVVDPVVVGEVGSAEVADSAEVASAAAVGAEPAAGPAIAPQ